MSAVVLLSGGLDSAVSMAMALEEMKVKKALTFDYGQRAALREIESARALCRHYGVSHQVIELKWLAALGGSALVDRSRPVPEVAPEDLEERADETAVQVWVPNRNGLFINIGACFAEALDCSLVVAGFNREEAQSFPDNSAAFVEAANRCLRFSTLNGVTVKSYTQDMSKREIVQMGRKLNLPFEYIWSCYYGGEKMCGRCESCQRLMRALGEKDR
ncbi:7-cyano-7-deazaguanine synthase QueC [Calderihabitans maritimus]|uniref:7-cyano-7-deazaguanine synthase n=1 Tax=Calderihabitans maritimus TaxID=1246530 RepID=A0A1Z5HXU5_9FIRM|nr:7-cyano-7-deazaguanine synthase QueC [Calderihabitans maritimus]GAW94238.1 exsB protein [Calderihabitans maritimus]